MALEQDKDIVLFLEENNPEEVGLKDEEDCIEPSMMENDAEGEDSNNNYIADEEFLQIMCQRSQSIPQLHIV